MKDIIKQELEIIEERLKNIDDSQTYAITYLMAQQDILKILLDKSKNI